MPPTLATTRTLAMVRTVESRGFETDDLLAAAGLTRRLVEDPDARLPGPTVPTLWNSLRQRSGDPSLQLIVPTTLPFGAYRVIDYLVAASANVGDGIERFARFFGLVADGVRLTLEAEGAERQPVPSDPRPHEGYSRLASGDVRDRSVRARCISDVSPRTPPLVRASTQRGAVPLARARISSPGCPASISTGDAATPARTPVGGGLIGSGVC